MLDKKPIIRTNHCRHGCVIPVGWVVNFVGTAKPLILQRSVGSVPKIYAVFRRLWRLTLSHNV